MMIRVYKAFAWVLGICSTLLSVILLAVAPLGTALCVIALFAFIMAGLILSIRKQASQPQTSAAETLPALPPMPRFGSGVQFLESIRLIDTTSDLHTLDSRLAVVFRLYGRFVADSRSDGYDRFAAREIARYLDFYRNRPIISMQQQFLLARPDYDALRLFLGRAIREAYVRHARKQAEQIRVLVRPSAKKKRADNLMARREEFIALYAKYAIPESDHVRHMEALSVDSLL